VSKSDYSIKTITKPECASLLLKYHYLKDISKGFKSGINYGLFKSDQLVGVCIYTGFPVPELVKGLFGLERKDQQGFYELSRLVLMPEIQKTEHNLASWFVSRTIKAIKKTENVRAILSYADNDFHSGTVYKACNFDYYGLTTAKKDFWILQSDGTHVKHSRGKTKGVPGEWRPRSQKHRFLKVYDNSLNINWLKIEQGRKL
tara:strand:- start:9 stop:614 length:606 start_codon:yes stop_codon:yes gene_type:complete